jgi:dynein light intermediate chain, axonemal
VTVNCAERGLLLLRVRDEIRMTLAAYQGLYESSIAFGMRKALIAEQRKSELQAKVSYRCHKRSQLTARLLPLFYACLSLVLFAGQAVGI